MTNETLIEKYLPKYTFREDHHTEVNSTVEQVYECSKDFDLSQSRVTRLLFKIRGLPTNRMNLQGFLKDMNFTSLEDSAPHEYLSGFWMKKKIESIPSYEAFISNAISAKIKVVWNFRCEEITPAATRLSTETRVLCVDSFTKFTFGLYWLVIRPFSGVIRLEMLKIIKADAEARRGDTSDDSLRDA